MSKSVMSKSVQHMFANLTAFLEDAHSLAVEGQSRDNLPDMSRVLVTHIRAGMLAIDSSLTEIAGKLDEDHV